MISYRASFFLALFAFLFSAQSQGKRNIKKDLVTLNSGDSLFTFEISEFQIKNPILRDYYSFKNFKIHKKQGFVYKNILNGIYECSISSFGIVEKGSFTYGLKNGVWKRWHNNGKLSSIEQWEDGLLNGAFSEFDQNSIHVKSGEYLDGNLHGKVLRGKNKDIIRFYFEGKEVNEENFNSLNQNNLVRLLSKNPDKEKKEKTIKKGKQDKERETKQKKKKESDIDDSN